MSNLRCSVLLRFTRWSNQKWSHVRKPIHLSLLLKVHSQPLPVPPRAPTAPGTTPVSAQRSRSCLCCWAKAPLTKRAASGVPVLHLSMASSLGTGPTHLSLNTAVKEMRLRCSEWDSRRKLMSPCPVFIRSSRSETLGGSEQKWMKIFLHFWEFLCRILQISGT